MKEKILLMTLERGLKSVALFKEEGMIIKGYEFILKEALKYLGTNINSLKMTAELTDKKLKKEKNKLILNEKIYNNLIKLETILAKNEEVKEMSEKYKTMFKEYKNLLKK